MTVLLLIAAVVVGYLAVMSILTPERFSKTRIAREAPIQVRLKEVAHVENAFHDVYNRYAPVDELRQFLTDGKIFYVRSEGDYTDAMREAGMNERQAAAKGLIVRDTVWVSARDSLLKDGMTRGVSTSTWLPRVNHRDRHSICRSGDWRGCRHGTCLPYSCTSICLPS